MAKILVYLEAAENRVTDLSLQCLVKGKEMAGAGDSTLHTVLLNSADDESIKEIFAHGADALYRVVNSQLEHYLPIPYKNVLYKIWQTCQPDILLLPASTQGNDLAPLLASETGAACVVDCQEVVQDNAALSWRKVEFDGKVYTHYAGATGVPQIVTLKDGIAQIGEPEGGNQGDIIDMDVSDVSLDSRSKVLKREIARKTVNLKDAKVIVAGGAGMRTRENFQLLEEFAERLGGEVGATRAAVDGGWIAADRQIGQTGETVKPDLYIACGISGAVQHRVGMLDSKKIIAINTDASAPIFKFSHYKIQADVSAVIPKLMSLLP